MRDFRKLRVFAEADSLAVAVYRLTRQLPADERFGLSFQLRKAAAGVAANIAEGSKRANSEDWLELESRYRGLQVGLSRLQAQERARRR